MTAQTQVYLYNQRQLVVLLERAVTGESRSYEVVYSKNLTISRGVDNLLEFSFINQNQKNVNVEGKEITARILNENGTEILLQKTLVPIFPITGLMALQLTVADIENIPAQYCYYSLEIPVDQFDYPVFVDAQGGARGKISIVNSVLPAFVPPKEITVPSHPPPTLNANAVVYYSSTINTVEAPILSTQLFFEKFTGNIMFEGSTLADFSLYYNLTGWTPYTDATSTAGFNIEGYHPYVRVKISNNGTLPVIANTQALQGDVVKILAR